MTSDEFHAARVALHLTQAELARELGLTFRTIKAYERGAWDNQRPAPVPRAIVLALEALEARQRVPRPR